MCGLGGIWQRQPDPERVPIFMAVLASYMEERGSHSWGAYHDGEITRGLGSITEGLDVKQTKDTRVLMFHTRFATVGAKTIANAHPFECGSIIGCHNGHVSNYEELNKKYERKFECDSPHIFAHIDEAKDLKEVEGRGAITYVVNNDPDSISLVRLDHMADLEVAVIREDKDPKSKDIGIAWASTKSPLEKALRVAGFHFTTRRVEAQERHYVDPNDEKELLFRDPKNPMRLGWPRIVTVTRNDDGQDWQHWRRGNYPVWDRSHDHDDIGARTRQLTTGVVDGKNKPIRKKDATRMRSMHRAGQKGVESITYRGNEIVLVGTCWGCDRKSRIWYSPIIDEYLCAPCDEKGIRNEDKTNISVSDPQTEADALARLFGAM